jgi:RES domain-containing protein
VITAWRICTAGLARRAFTGEGAFLYGGRWNPPGTRMVYAAGSQSLAALEMLVHTEDANDLVTLQFVAIPVEIDEVLIADAGKLPKSWAVYPARPGTAKLGDEWIRSGRSCVLRVPSAVIRAERNYLINPLHADFRKLRIGRPVAFTFDSRLS